MSRRGLLRGAAATGIVAVTTAAVTLGWSSAAHAAQPGWRWCELCQGLWNVYNDNDHRICPWNYDGLRRNHTSLGSGNYVVKLLSDGGAGQSGWSWCTLCSGLNFHPLNNTSGSCPSSRGNHLNVYDFRVEVHWGNDGPGGQSGWRYCQGCRGLWFSGNGSRGFCPYYGSGGHSLAGSGDYKLRFGPAY